MKYKFDGNCYNILYSNLGHCDALLKGLSQINSGAGTVSKII